MGGIFRNFNSIFREGVIRSKKMPFFFIFNSQANKWFEIFKLHFCFSFRLFKRNIYFKYFNIIILNFIHFSIMMASVKYQFGVLRSTKNTQSPTIHQDYMHFSLEDDDEQYSSLHGNCNNTAIGQSSRLLRTKSGESEYESANGHHVNEERKWKKHNNGIPAAKEATKQNQYAAKNTNVDTERNRGRTPMRNSNSKSNSLLTDEFELDDVLEEEDELNRNSGSDDEDDLLRTFSQQNNGHLQFGGDEMMMNAAEAANSHDVSNVSKPGTWRYKLRRRLNTLTCCFSMIRTGDGFTQFQ